MATALKSNTVFRQAKWLGLAGVLSATLSWAALGGPARAATPIQDKLPAEAGKVVDFLKNKGYRNVGVLKFRVQKGNQKESFSIGPMSVSVTRSLENLLIIQAGRSSNLRIIQEAYTVAAGHKDHVTSRTSAGLAKLFSYDYRLAWGDEKVKADAFLTGVVKLSSNKRQTTVLIEAIDRETRKRTPVTSFAVRTDRSILTDLCESFVLNKRRIQTMDANEQDGEAVKNAEQREQKKGKAQSDEQLVSLEIVYDGAPQEETPSDEHPGEHQVPTPTAGAKVTLVLKNLTEKRIAVVLAVNGQNTLYQQDLAAMDPLTLTKWVLEPGVRYQLQGFYSKDDKKVAPFEVLSDEETTTEEQSPRPKLGAIEMLVFAEGGTGSAGKEPAVTAGLRKPLIYKKRPRTAKEAALQARKNASGRTTTANLLRGGSATEDADLQTTAFKNPQHVQTKVIWYHSRSKGAQDTENKGKQGAENKGNDGTEE